MDLDISKLVTKYSGMALDYAPKILMALVTLVVGFWIIGRIVKFAKNAIQASGMDETLAKFLSSLVSILLKIMGHAASGVMLMIFKPFKVGDLVKIGGNQTMGTVADINAFNTVLKTLDNKRIIIANSNVTGNDITNVTGEGEVGVELTYGIGYNDDIDKARKIILDVGTTCPHILSSPAQGVVVANLGDSSVDLATRPFCKPEHYWDVLFYMQENVKKQFDTQGIGIPYPTMDLNVVRQN